MSIPGPEVSSKQALLRVPADLVLVGIAVLACAASFGLGILAGKEMDAKGQEDAVWIEQLSRASEGQVASALAATPEPAAPTTGKYVASKTGEKYYLPSCGSAKRIKEENKVWFDTKEDAERAGYEPATNCKGL